MKSTIFLLVAMATGMCEAPSYQWRPYQMPRELRGNEGAPGVRGELAVSGDGSRVFFATPYGAVLLDAQRAQALWCEAFKCSVRGVGFLGEDRLVLSTGTQLIQLARRDGRILKRFPCRLERFAILRTGLLVGTVPTADGLGRAHAIVSPEDGSAFFGFGNQVSSICVAVADQSGTLFATGGPYGDVWIGDPYVRALRRLTWSYTYGWGDPIHAVCFHPSGRYLAVSWHGCRVAVLDLLEPGEWDLERAPEQLGKLASAGNCGGMGFVGSHWLWLGTERELVFRRWPEKAPTHSIAAPGKAEFYVWKASEEGNLLAGPDTSGTLWLGRLIGPRSPDPRPPARGRPQP